MVMNRPCNPTLTATATTPLAGSHAPNCGQLKGSHAPKPHRRNALTCTNTGQGQEGQVIRKPPSRTRTCARAEKVLDHVTLLTLRAHR